MNEIKRLENVIKELRHDNKEIKAKADSIAKQINKANEYSTTYSVCKMKRTPHID